MEQTKSMETKRIVIFLAFTFVVTYAIEIGVIRNLINSTDTTMNVIAQLATAGVMLIPTLGVLFTRIVTKEGFKNHWLKPNLKGNIKYYLIAWFGPAVLTLLGALVYFLVFPKSSFREFPAAVLARAEFILPISTTVTTPGLECIANNCSTCTAIEFKSFK